MGEEMGAGQQHLKEEMRGGQEILKEEMLAKLDAHDERLMARMDSQLEKMEACLGKMEAADLEANPEEIEFKAEREEIPKEEAAVETFGTLKERYEDCHLAVRCCSQPKKRNQVSGGCRKKFANAQVQLTCML
jgi:hypothetical protein